LTKFLNFYYSVLVSAGLLVTPAVFSQESIAISVSVAYAISITDSINNANAQQLTDSLMPPKTYTIAGVGDIMLGTSFPSRKYLPPQNNPNPLIADLIPYLSDSDITFGNLEGPFTDNAPLTKQCKDTTICYAFRMPESYASVLSNAGFDLLSLANNHFGDFGQSGRETTMKLLDSLNIGYAGLDSKPYTIFEKDSVLYGFCAFAPNRGTININDYKRAREILKILNDTCDIIIVSFHGGAEGAAYEHVTGKPEEFYGENRGNVVEFAHMVIDNGADIVFGHGPHVTRAIDVYNNRFIAYSLGNFLTYRRFNLSGPNGISPLVQVEVDRSGNFLKALIVPVYQNSQGHVKIDPSKRVITRIRELVRSDFPSSQIEIDDNGIVKLKNVL
jgi:poly-gamma-glutamate capsule biosynthesis protein CapA/YwtB (metallophosphatase superfamily)